MREPPVIIVNDIYAAHPYPIRDHAVAAKHLITRAPFHPLDRDHDLLGGLRHLSQGLCVLWVNSAQAMALCGPLRYSAVQKG